MTHYEILNCRSVSVFVILKNSHQMLANKISSYIKRTIEKSELSLSLNLKIDSIAGNQIWFATLTYTRKIMRISMEVGKIWKNPTPIHCKNKQKIILSKWEGKGIFLNFIRGSISKLKRKCYLLILSLDWSMNRWVGNAVEV